MYKSMFTLAISLLLTLALVPAVVAESAPPVSEQEAHAIAVAA